MYSHVTLFFLGNQRLLRCFQKPQKDPSRCGSIKHWYSYWWHVKPPQIEIYYKHCFPILAQGWWNLRPHLTPWLSKSRRNFASLPCPWKYIFNIAEPRSPEIHCAHKLNSQAEGVPNFSCWRLTSYSRFRTDGQKSATQEVDWLSLTSRFHTRSSRRYRLQLCFALGSRTTPVGLVGGPGEGIYSLPETSRQHDRC